MKLKTATQVYEDFSIRQLTTPAEQAFKKKLLTLMIRLGVKGEFSHGEAFAIPVVTGSARNPAIKNQLAPLFSQWPTIQFTIRRGDFVIHALGLVIEIDGGIHHRPHVIERGRTRDAEWKCLGFHVYVIPNDSIYDEDLLRGHLYQIEQVILKHLNNLTPEDVKAYQRRRKAASRARAALLRLAPRLRLGTYDKRREVITDRETGFPARVQFDGVRFNLEEIRAAVIREHGRAALHAFIDEQYQPTR